MFSSNTGKILGLQNEYINRITKNSIKLNKQLNLLIEIQSTLKNQMGGADEKNKTYYTQNATEHQNLYHSY